MRKLFLIFLLLILSTLFACGEKEDTFDPLGLAQVQDANHLKELLKTESDVSFWNFFATRSVMEDDFDAAPQDNAHSTTNVQVEGIDEGDIVKTDGNRIYFLRYNALTVVEIDENGAMETVFNQARSENEYGHYTELYVTDNKLIVVGSFYEVEVYPSRGEIDSEFFYFPMYYTMSTVDIYDKTTMVLEDAYQISGHLTGSRLIGDHLYLISSHSGTSDQDDPRPYFNLNEERIVPDYQEIRYLPDLPTRAFTVISTIKLAEDNLFEYDIFLGVSAWGHLYVSENGIYMASNYYTASTSTSSTRDEDIAISSWETQGKIISYRFNENRSVEYGGSGDFKGMIINQFAMDEYNDTFRVVTRDGWGQSAINRLYIFERDYADDKPYLKQLALLDEGIGKPEETVRSVRFNKDIVTIVTFEEIDPFYVIDLSDPENPTILGELEMPGFSTYQHPWKDDTIIGIGYETNDVGWVIGLKLSLYDISDYENPIEVGVSLVFLNDDQGWQYGEALHNHKAILVSEPFDFIGFSINRSTWENYYKHHSDYLIFDIDTQREHPIQISASISHYELFEETANDDWYYGFNVNRAITINHYLYVLSNGAITRHDISDDFNHVDSILFID